MYHRVRCSCRLKLREKALDDDRGEHKKGTGQGTRGSRARTIGAH